jgi:hypothetical protein
LIISAFLALIDAIVFYRIKAAFQREEILATLSASHVVQVILAGGLLAYIPAKEWK